MRDTLRTTSNRGVSVVASQAGAHGSVVRFSTLGVLATRRWHAGVRVLRLKWRRRRLWHRSTEGEWISCVSVWAVAHDDVVNHVTFCSRAALARARVLAFVPIAVLVPRAVSVEDTFRLASDVGISEVLITADAHSNPVLIAAVGVGSAR